MYFTINMVIFTKSQYITAIFLTWNKLSYKLILFLFFLSTKYGLYKRILYTLFCLSFIKGISFLGKSTTVEIVSVLYKEIYWFHLPTLCLCLFSIQSELQYQSSPLFTKVQQQCWWYAREQPPSQGTNKLSRLSSEDWHITQNCCTMGRFLSCNDSFRNADKSSLGNLLAKP